MTWERDLTDRELWALSYALTYHHADAMAQSLQPEIALLRCRIGNEITRRGKATMYAEINALTYRP